MSIRCLIVSFFVGLIICCGIIKLWCETQLGFSVCLLRKSEMGKTKRGKFKVWIYIMDLNWKSYLLIKDWLLGISWYELRFRISSFPLVDDAVCLVILKICSRYHISYFLMWDPPFACLCKSSPLVNLWFKYELVWLIS